MLVATGLAQPVGFHFEQAVERVLDRLEHDFSDMLLQQTLVDLQHIRQRDYGLLKRLRGRGGRGP